MTKKIYGIIKYELYREDGTLKSAMSLELSENFYKKKGCKAIKGIANIIRKDIVDEPRKKWLKEQKKNSLGDKND
jgi:hypothetical protein